MAFGDTRRTPSDIGGHLEDIDAIWGHLEDLMTLWGHLEDFGDTLKTPGDI